MSECPLRYSLFTVLYDPLVGNAGRSLTQHMHLQGGIRYSLGEQYSAFRIHESDSLIPRLSSLEINLLNDLWTHSYPNFGVLVHGKVKGQIIKIWNVTRRERLMHTTLVVERAFERVRGWPWGCGGTAVQRHMGTCCPGSTCGSPVLWSAAHTSEAQSTSHPPSTSYCITQAPCM